MVRAKVSQTAAKYRGYPHHNVRCDHCEHFLPPNACEIVAGEISKHGYCSRFFKAKRADWYSQKDKSDG